MRCRWALEKLRGWLLHRFAGRSNQSHNQAGRSCSGRQAWALVNLEQEQPKELLSSVAGAVGIGIICAIFLGRPEVVRFCDKPVQASSRSGDRVDSAT